ncbi:Highly reducing polyketide synthase sor1, partial [Dissostichus eleginoides]
NFRCPESSVLFYLELLQFQSPASLDTTVFAAATSAGTPITSRRPILANWYSAEEPAWAYLIIMGLGWEERACYPMLDSHWMSHRGPRNLVGLS